MKNLKSLVPWWGKIALKIILSRLRFDYQEFWKKYGLFINGPMQDPVYALDVFQSHFNHCCKKSFVCLELGCGDSLASALIAKQKGATSTYLIDAADFATKDMNVYSKLASHLGVDVDFCTIDSYLKYCNASYLTNGLASLKSIKNNSVDLIFSQAVLEHIRKREFVETVAQLKRILKPGGMMSHRVDFKDHLNSSLNSLRFSDMVWESELFANAGFYTNRIRYSEMIDMFEREKLTVEVLGVERWSELPLGKHKLAKPYRTMGFDDLSVSSLNVVLRNEKNN